MEEEPDHNSPISSASSSSNSQVQEEEEESHHYQREGQEFPQHEHHLHRGESYVPNTMNPFVPQAESTNDASSCLIVSLTLCFFASLTSIMGFYGSENLQLGPHFSHILQANSLLVTEIKVEEVSGPNNGLIMYGFHAPPPLTVETNWSETHRISILPNSHKEWVYYLNEESEIDINYSVKSNNSPSLLLVIARGKESLAQWIDDPSYPNHTLSWNYIHGSGKIQQKLFKSSYYYVAVGNLYPEEVKLNFRIRAFLYNTSDAYCKCSLAQGLCSFKVLLLGASTAVLTSPGPEKSGNSDDWYVKLSYEPRWSSYFIGSGAMTLLILLAGKICIKFQSTSRDGVGHQAGEGGPERTQLLAHKDDDASSWGSSYESVSHDEEDGEGLLAPGSLETNSLKEGDINHPRRLCVICFDAPRDSFFLPCGHCAACFTCGTRIVEEAGTCPICRRKMKKVRKIFTV
ncbi:hypothetical protein AQUCO_04500088v1 [Aquilegia coerulea]|uniref:RING-type domain-containing protein n=1 Tax=Aquilegia coerulea TaxID=218851 RepID=A0A2G5CLT5_AQUCA|nr:hypothetical protein AQUCO_04500088v1 [Aquilegia coerulea]